MCIRDRKEAVNAGWSVREMKRQIDSSLFERLLLSRGDANKEQVLALAEKGVDYAKPEDIIKDPYVFEFLLELGGGFMFVGEFFIVFYFSIHNMSHSVTL